MMPFSIRGYLQRDAFFHLAVLGLLVANFSAVRVGNRLEGQIENLSQVPVSRPVLPGRFEPMQGIDQQGNSQLLDYRREKMLLAVFDPRLRNFDTELEVWNQVARQAGEQLQVIGISASQEQLEEVIGGFEFPVLRVSSRSVLEKNSILYLPYTIVVLKGGLVKAAWVGDMDDDSNREALAEALLVEINPPLDSRVH